MIVTGGNSDQFGIKIEDESSELITNRPRSSWVDREAGSKERLRLGDELNLKLRDGFTKLEYKYNLIRLII